MGKTIKIGVLCVTYSLLVMKSQPLLAQGETKSGNDTIRTLEELVIDAGRPTPFQPLVRVVAVIQQKEIERAAVQNLTDLLRYIQGTDLRSRGSEGVQADINILGGTFDQTMVMINGINFTDPQTGHHSLNIPVELSQIDRIEILQGPGAWSNGSVAYSGAINIITKNPSKTGVNVSLLGGSFGYFKGSANIGFRKITADRSWQISGQAGGGHSRSDGFADNTDFGITNLFSNVNITNRRGHSFALQAGFQSKDFGANSFYSIAYPEQFEATRLFLSSIQYQYMSGRWQIKASVYQRRHFDRFELFRYEAPAWYKGHNYHQNDILGFNAQAAYRWGKGGTSIIGVDYRIEHIFSTVLGDDMTSGKPAPFEDGIEYTKAKGREIPSLYLKHLIQLEKWRFTAGLMLSDTYNTASSSYGTRLYAGLAAAYQINPYLEANGWINNSYRNPTFTDLYYKSPTQTGNMGLKPEEAVAAQVGLKLTKSEIRASLSAFYRYGYRIIDWTRASGSDQWQAGNITDIRSAGFELNAAYIWKTGWINQMGASYAYLNVAKETGNLHSLYATDYLRHKASLFIDHDVFSKLSARWDLSFQKRAGTYLGAGSSEVPYKSFALVDIKLLWSEKWYQVFVEATNLLNTDYLYIGNLPQPGRWIKAGVGIDL